jgi:hypothetical protein
MNFCWAACLGDCSDKTTNEHLVSKGLFSGNAVEMFGFEWCKDKPAQIGLTNATAKILCKTHNNQNSELDDAAKDGFDAIREMLTLSDERQKLKPGLWNIKTYVLDGRKMERWFLKTLINLTFEKDHPIGRDSTVAGKPSDRLVRIAYGLEPFQGKAGLYHAVQRGSSFSLNEKVGFMPIYNRLNDHVEAAAFSFYGFQFVLFLEEEGPPEGLNVNELNFEGTNLADATLTLHPKVLNNVIGKYVSHRLVFRW